jgi:hypothetical protein
LNTGMDEDEESGMEKRLEGLHVTNTSGFELGGDIGSSFFG